MHLNTKIDYLLSVYQQSKFKNTILNMFSKFKATRMW